MLEIQRCGVCVVPCLSLTVDNLYRWFMNVVKALHEIFLVIAVSVDKHVVNRSSFKQLSDSESIKPYINHLCVKNEKLFLFFDFTHNLKNIFNNWLKRGKMNPPTNGLEHYLGDLCIALYSHVKQLYALEEESRSRSLIL